MFKHLTYDSTRDLSAEEWEQMRQSLRTIGGSDAASILGMNEYDSPYSVWARLTGKIPAEDIGDKESVRLGKDLEQYVAERFTEKTGKKLRRCNAVIRNPDFPFAHANVDRLVVGEDAGFEAKTTSSWDVAKQCRDGKFPDRYYCQCVHYLAITGAQKWYLGVLCFGSGFYEFCIEKDEAEIRALMDAESDFWSMVQNDTPPGVDANPRTQEAIRTIYSECDGGTVDLMGRESVFEELAALKWQSSVIDRRMAELQNIICEDMQSAAYGVCGRWKASWKQCAGRKSFSVQSLAKEHPEIDISKYYEQGKPYRVFKVSENKE